MCTVTIVPTKWRAGGDRPAAIRMMGNRDESHDRAMASPPATHQIGSQRALFPVDPTSGGTWIAVNASGLIFTLLNSNPGDMRGTVFAGRASRGRIIPSLLEAESFEQAYKQAGQLRAGDYSPFRLVFTDGDSLAEVGSAGEKLWRQRRGLDVGPVMFTSSGLGDSVVEPPRRDLFEHWFGHDPDAWLAQQETFHRHTWPGYGQVSVCMSRGDARTVSRTTVDLDMVTARAEMGYVGIGTGGEEFSRRGSPRALNG